MIIPSHSFGVVAASRKKIVVASSPDYDPDAVNWSNIIDNSFACDLWASAGVQQITGINQSITLRLTGHQVTEENTNPPPYSFDIFYRKSSTSFSANSGGCSQYGFYDDPAISNFTNLNTYRSGAGSPAGTITIEPNEYLEFVYSNSSAELVIKVFNLSGSTPNTPLDTFSISITGCYLTSVIVRYFGLLDTGPELTSMRALRNHYKNVPGYSEILSEYSTVSSGIISGIEESDNKHSEYTYIHNTVIAVMNHVNAEEWEQAHDLYMAMYMDLKTRYVG
jgi:hypothetical protein